MCVLYNKLIFLVFVFDQVSVYVYGLSVVEKMIFLRKREVGRGCV